MNAIFSVGPNSNGYYNRIERYNTWNRMIYGDNELIGNFKKYDYVASYNRSKNESLNSFMDIINDIINSEYNTDKNCENILYDPIKFIDFVTNRMDVCTSSSYGWLLRWYITKFLNKSEYSAFPIIQSAIRSMYTLPKKTTELFCILFISKGHLSKNINSSPTDNFYIQSRYHEDTEQYKIVNNIIEGLFYGISIEKILTLKDTGMRKLSGAKVCAGIFNFMTSIRNAYFTELHEKELKEVQYCFNHIPDIISIIDYNKDESYDKNSVIMSCLYNSNYRSYNIYAYHINDETAFYKMIKPMIVYKRLCVTDSKYKESSYTKFNISLEKNIIPKYL